MKNRLLCALICLSMLLGMIPAVSLVTTAETGYLTEEEIEKLTPASKAELDDGINAYKIDSVDELIAAAAVERVGTAHVITQDTYSIDSNYIHEKYVESSVIDRGDYSTLDTIYITADLDITAWSAANPDKSFAELFDGFNADGGGNTTMAVNLNGLGHTITGFTDNHALICGDLIGSVKNLTLTDAKVETAILGDGDGFYSAAILCQRTGVGGALIENVHMDNCHMTTAALRAGLFVRRPYGAGEDLTFVNCSINNSSITSTYEKAQGVGLFLGDFGGNYFKAYNCIAANSTVTVPSIKTADDGSALLFGTVDNGGQVKSVVFDNVASFNNTFITNDTTTVGIIASFGNVRYAPVTATNTYAFGNVTKTAADAEEVPLTTLYLDAYNYIKSIDTKNNVTDAAVTMAVNKALSSGKTAVNKGASSNLTLPMAIALMNGNASANGTAYTDWAVTESSIGVSAGDPYIASFQLEDDNLHFMADAQGKITFTAEQKELLAAHKWYLGTKAATVDFDDLTLTANAAYTLLPLPDYSIDYPNASGVQFPDSTHQLRMKNTVSATPLTFSALLNLEEGEWGVIAGNSYSAGSYTHGKGRFTFYITEDGTPCLQWATTDNTYYRYLANDLNLQGKGWNHLTAVFDPELDTIEWYLNGALCQVTTNATITPTTPYQQIKIGGTYAFTKDSTTQTSTYNTSCFTGELGYVSLWSSLRTAEEIAAEAAALQANATAVPTAGEGLLGSWSFAGNGDVLTTTYADRSANGNDVAPYCEMINDYDENYLKEQGINTEIEKGDYSIVVMPDIQNMVRDYGGPSSAYFESYLQWIVDHKEEYNILAYMNMGDLTHNQGGTTEDYVAEWETVRDTFAKTLDQSGIAGLPMRGNHDRTAYYNEYIDYDHYASQEWFGGVYEEGYLDNSYWYIETEDENRKYLVFSLGWSAHGKAMANSDGMGDPDNKIESDISEDPDLMAWVNEVIAAHPEHNVIFTAHNGMNYNGAWSVNGQGMYDNILSKNDNIVLSTYGHVSAPTVVERTDPRGDGVEFSSLLVDFQHLDQYAGPFGMIAILTFNYDSDEVAVNWHSVRYDSLYRADSQYTINVPHVQSSAALRAAIADTEALFENDYSADSWTALQATIADAQEVLNDEAATQADYDNAETAIRQAITDLVDEHTCVWVNCTLLNAEEHQYVCISNKEHTRTEAHVMDSNGEACTLCPFSPKGGDVNEDGATNLLDVMIFLRRLAGKDYNGTMDLRAFFLNGDNTADMADAVLMLRLAAGWDELVSMPPEDAEILYNEETMSYYYNVA